MIAGSKSQNALWNAITAGIGIRDKDKRGILIDPRSPEEILSDELPAVDSPDAMEKTAIRFGRCYGILFLIFFSFSSKHSSLLKDKAIGVNLCLFIALNLTDI